MAAERTMKIRFWGVRGSIATAGSHTALVGGNTSCVEVRAGGELIILDEGTVVQFGAAGEVLVRTAPAQHPNGCLAFRIDAGGRSLVYATDTEHPGDERADENLRRLAGGADVLVYDAQYTAAEYRAGK